MRDGEPETMISGKEMTETGPIQHSQTVKISKVCEDRETLFVENSQTDRDYGIKTTDEEKKDNEDTGVESDSNANEESVTSSKLYPKEAGVLYKETKHRCPIPKCWKTFRKVSQIKGHVAFHFFKLVSKEFPFKKDQECSLCVSKKKTVLKTLSGHVYHYGVTHKQLLNIIPDTDENKQIVIQLLK